MASWDTPSHPEGYLFQSTIADGKEELRNDYLQLIRLSLQELSCPADVYDGGSSKELFKGRVQLIYCTGIAWSFCGVMLVVEC